MRAAAVKYGGVRERVSSQMSRAQALRLKNLAEEAYQPEQYANDLTLDEAARHIDALKAEIELADSILTGLYRFTGSFRSLLPENTFRVAVSIALCFGAAAQQFAVRAVRGPARRRPEAGRRKTA